MPGCVAVAHRRPPARGHLGVAQVVKKRNGATPAFFSSRFPRLTNDDLETIRMACDDIEKAGEVADVLTMSAANRRLHFTISRARAGF